MIKYDSEWNNVTLSDPNTIKGLLKFRHKYDLLLDKDTCRHGLESNGDLADLSEDIICLYSDLDFLIDKAKFNAYQLSILDLYMAGNNEEDISDIMGVSKQAINKNLNSISDVLSYLNYENWKMNYVLWDVKPVDDSYKQCVDCGEFMPMTTQYFREDSRNSDGHYGTCRVCERKKRKN